MRLLGVFERQVLYMFAQHKVWIPQRSDFFVHRAQCDAANALREHGLVEELDYDGDYPTGWRVSELGRLHLEHPDLPLIGSVTG